MSLQFIALHGAEIVEISEEDVDYVTEDLIEGETFVRIHTNDGREVIPLLDVDDSFNEVKGEEKRVFLRSKIRPN
ncbi:hypothetical protein [Paenibacillus pinihumi]|uniref:hypothetical protein n=1 Tax=Paenibacillus pinihumi TaxID=669462 RepID=UPI00041A85EC|nr:hypothetical protein [Paenibacillus pinihumi]